MRWAYSGAAGSNETAPLVYEYAAKKVLAGIGYRFDDSELTQFDVEVFTTIASEFARIESEEIKKARRRR